MDDVTLEIFTKFGEGNISKGARRVVAHMMQLEQHCDPSGTVRENAQLKDVVKELEASNALIRGILGETR